jgi:adenosine deaminase
MIDLRKLPKTELHLHFEGAVPPETLLQLIHKYGDRSKVPDLTTLQSKFRYRDFRDFITVYVWAVKYFREYEDFSLAASGIVRELAAQNVRYAEIYFSPGLFERAGLKLQLLAKAIRAGLSISSEVKTRLMVDLVRESGPARGDRQLSEAAEVAGETDIVAIGIGGSEDGFPPHPFAPVFRRAEALGLHRVAHAGEWAGAESIWGAVRALRVERIGHGTRSFEDPTLMRYLRQMGIPLEVCLTSNLCTGVVAAIKNHPIQDYFRMGIPITLSSDDPTLFHTDLVAEYRLLREELGMNDDDLVRIARTGFEAAFMSDSERKKFLSVFESAVADLRS